MSAQKRKPHFEYLGGKLRWVASKSHTYSLRPSNRNLQLRATVGTKILGLASTIDHLIWNEIVQKASSDWCESLTLWTRDVEFNILVFGSDHAAQKLTCAYFTTPKSEMCKEHFRYWKAVGVQTDSLKSTPDYTQLRFKAKSDSAKEIRRMLRDQTAINIVSHLPQIVVWNRYQKRSVTKNGTVHFARQHALAFDRFRRELQTIPVPTGFLDEGSKLCLGCAPKVAADRFYRLVLESYDTVAGCGSAMQRNLLALASLLVDSNIKVVLVTGEPGTGKENLSKAIYYGNKIRQPGQSEEEAVFFQTTAVAIQNALSSQKTLTPGEFIRREIMGRTPSRVTRPIRPVIYIDELNKAGQHFLASMLRPLEQGKAEIGCDRDPKFILAASQHIDDLAKKPPQDFWTRISHQLRVVHPLSRVSEDDGAVFLDAFFYAQWWSYVEAMIRENKESPRNFVRTFLGKIVHGKLTPSPLCRLVRGAFLNTLVPFVSRDTLSIRGARSILSQVFARVSWYVRFESPIGNSLNEKHVARLVNSAVQDVLAILNAARATPPTTVDNQE